MCTFTFSIASIPEQLQHEKQCQDICGDKPAGLLRSHHITIEWPGECSDPKVVVGISALPNVNKHRRAKQTRRLPSWRQTENKNDTGFGGLGFILCLLKQKPPHSSLPSPQVLRQLHLVDRWQLGFIQHLKICSLGLLLQALAKFLTNKHLPVKLKMELLIK